MPVQHSREPLHLYPCLQATSALKAENDHLKAEVEDVLIRFYIAQSEVGLYKEVVTKQKQEIVELHKQVADAGQHSSDTYEELDSANACAMHQQDHLEELEDMVCHYQDRAHVAEGLIRQYPEDEGLYEVELPSLSELQGELDMSEDLVCHLATFAHRLYTANPTHLLHYHNHIIHTPEHLHSIVKLMLEYLSKARFTHGKLHLVRPGSELVLGPALVLSGLGLSKQDSCLGRTKGDGISATTGVGSLTSGGCGVWVDLAKGPGVGEGGVVGEDGGGWGCGALT
ncbi:hypothetical protein F5877DRAFT_72836 [Lentinula edodes]|nr:hypothetical protein F5877DRAFT_72836 [Lentinula edodes]